MFFASPFFLLALGALAAPVFLHLLRRQTSTPRPFSSLMFFEPRTQASMRHRRLRYLWLLALRLGLLAALVLTFADPYILRPAASVTNNRLTAIVIDHSFSMRASAFSTRASAFLAPASASLTPASTRLADAKRQALAAVANTSGKAQIMALGERLEILTQPTTDKSVLRAAINAIPPSDTHADYATLARGIRALAQSTPTPIRLDFFSDLKQSSLPASFADLALPANVTFVPHPIAVAAPNLSLIHI